MNQEHDQHAYPDRKDDPAQDLVDAINAASTPEAGLRLAALYNERGMAAIAFTRLAAVDTNTADLFSKFEEVFLATYETNEAFIKEQLDAQGWLATTDDYLATSGIPPDFLVWDHSAVLRRLRDIYEVVEYGGQVHVFAW